MMINYFDKTEENKELYRKAIKGLQRLLDGNVDRTTQGVCSNMFKDYEDTRGIGSSIVNVFMKAYGDEYKYYSGSPIYPVAAWIPELELDEVYEYYDEDDLESPIKTAEIAYDFTENTWIGVYGERRKELCRFLINKIEDVIFDGIRFGDCPQDEVTV